MPIYDFRCKECQHEMELFLKSNEADPSTCPECQKESLVRCLSAPKFRLSGSGWYETDEKPQAKQRNVTRQDDSSSSKENTTKSETSEKS